ncbi:hypothetical protein DYB38_007193 [Aphanomyces astaci]|uniref:Uncharacterized protein n=1 Tax=Aphanomyces astaci TaxID=112090 RepID=A0A397B989_APHAT|nr:hypothetical protein DYB36_008402 [Aphanomyces astaci]RHY65736.1 hypothetical protein DYB38_007193 [Aphanomyces astaci]
MSWVYRATRFTNAVVSLVTANAYISTLGGGFFLCRHLNQAKLMAQLQICVSQGLHDPILARYIHNMQKHHVNCHLSKCRINLAYGAMARGKFKRAQRIINDEGVNAKALRSDEIHNVCHAAQVYLDKTWDLHRSRLVHEPTDTTQVVDEYYRQRVSGTIGSASRQCRWDDGSSMLLAESETCCQLPMEAPLFMLRTKSTQHVHTRGRTKHGGRAHAPAAPAPRTASSIARLTSGKDVCVVAHHGTVDWVATYYVYGFDKNSLFHLLVPLRHPNEPWTDAETAYLTILARLLHSLEAYVAEKLHAPEPRIRVQLQTVKCEIDAETGRQLLTDGHRPKGVMTPDEAAQLKQVGLNKRSP